MRVADVMRAQVLSIGPDASISKAIGIMMENCTSGLPVVESSGELVGIITEGDLLRRVELDTARHRRGWLDLLLGAGGSAGQYVRTHARRVGEVMTRNVLTVGEDTPLEEVVELMERKHVKRLPVLRGTRIVGMLSRADLVRALGRALDTSAAGHGSDAAIRERLFSELRAESWFHPLNVTYEVRDAVVTLHGTISDERERAALRVAATNVPGVKQVQDKLVWVEPAVQGLAF